MRSLPRFSRVYRSSLLSDLPLASNLASEAPGRDFMGLVSSRILTPKAGMVATTP